jgi:hypothetical protein
LLLEVSFMSFHSVAPALIYPGQPARSLAQLPKIHSKFDERFLQELLARSPELLPAAAIRQDVGNLLCVGREVGVPSGSIDNLYISTAGYTLAGMEPGKGWVKRLKRLEKSEGVKKRGEPGGWRKGGAVEIFLAGRGRAEKT